MSSYFRNIAHVSQSLLKGLQLTFGHLRRRQRREPMSITDPEYFRQQGRNVTIQYPAEKIPVPDTGRHRLYMETEDCIGCDKCANVCPVDCITIEKIKATDDLGTTSDGSKKKFYLPTFDIDMAKCMYCGLCTVVCPTECLVMTKSYDYSVYDRDNLVFHFGNLSPEEAEQKQRELDEFEAAKKAAKQKAAQQKKAQQQQNSGQADATRTKPSGDRSASESSEGGESSSS
jgi:formate hydrogenlyase subunit 6/NADH:ubiquinone oxidoreductase subunit I